MQRYQLRFIYGNLRSAIRRRDWPAAWRELGRALAAQLPACPDPTEIRVAASLMRDQLSYRGAKPAELAMLRNGIKTLVKLEDLPVDEALALAREAAGTHTTVVSALYRKDYLLLRTRPAAPGDVDPLITLYCSVDDSARELWRMEANQREDPRRAGRLLQIPPCCIDAFARDCDRARHDQDTLNDDACRRVLATATPSDPGDWRLNPLANDELLGFYPCTARCPAAAQRAGQVLAALPTEQAQRAERQLRRPALYFRLPFFATFADCWQGDHLVVDDCAVNALPDRATRTAQALFATALQTELLQAPTLHNDRLPYAAGHSDVESAAPPLLCRWQ